MSLYKDDCLTKVTLRWEGVEANICKRNSNGVERLQGLVGFQNTETVMNVSDQTRRYC